MKTSYVVALLFLTGCASRLQLKDFDGDQLQDQEMKDDAACSMEAEEHAIHTPKFNKIYGDCMAAKGYMKKAE